MMRHLPSLSHLPLTWSSQITRETLARQGGSSFGSPATPHFLPPTSRSTEHAQRGFAYFGVLKIQLKLVSFDFNWQLAAIKAKYQRYFSIISRSQNLLDVELGNTVIAVITAAD